VQTARRLVTVVVELAARMKRRQDDLERAAPGLVFRVGLDRDATPVVFDRDGLAPGVERDLNARGMTVDGLVDGVVHDLPDEVMQTLFADTTDVHARAFAYGLEALEDGDVLGAISAAGRRGGRLHQVFSAPASVSPAVSSPPSGGTRISTGHSHRTRRPRLRMQCPLPPRADGLKLVSRTMTSASRFV
jgi:hypothetical protein